DDAGDVDALAPEALDRAERRAAGGDGVLEDDDLGPRGEALGALDEAAGAVTLLGLPHVEGIQRAPFEGRSEAHGARERAAAELHARDGVDLLAEPLDGVQEDGPDEAVPLGREHGGLAVDEEVALATAREDEFPTLEGAVTEE